ncbi:TPA: helix-turn-helix transcriptional regulator [Enterococcus faecalis]|nr:helix-turn-helix transcriptional regulator [Enterococcus faecalis]
MNRIKKLRKEKGITVADLAKKIGVSQSMLSNYENGNSKPRDQKIWNDMAQYFQVDVSYLMGLSNNRSFENTNSLIDFFKTKENNDPVKITLNGDDPISLLNNPVTLIENDFTFEDIYDELNKENKDILYNIAQALWKSQELDDLIKTNFISEKK